MRSVNVFLSRLLCLLSMTAKLKLSTCPIELVGFYDTAALSDRHTGYHGFCCIRLRRDLQQGSSFLRRAQTKSAIQYPSQCQINSSSPVAVASALLLIIIMLLLLMTLNTINKSLKLTSEFGGGENHLFGERIDRADRL